MNQIELNQLKIEKIQTLINEWYNDKSFEKTNSLPELYLLGINNELNRRE